jgi:hypothetical protein
MVMHLGRCKGCQRLLALWSDVELCDECDKASSAGAAPPIGAASNPGIETPSREALLGFITWLAEERPNGVLNAATVAREARLLLAGKPEAEAWAGRVRAAGKAASR